MRDDFPEDLVLSDAQLRDIIERAAQLSDQDGTSIAFMAHPNSWRIRFRSVPGGTPEALYCNIPGQGFPASNFPHQR